ncbi:MAG: cytochrome P450 [Candidatus Melainabacteria bacterium]|nr:cytochrome P450 [Candidatus Melainabacteria bacterium]
MNIPTASTPDANAIFDPIMDHSEERLANPYPVLEQMRQSGGSVIFSPRGNQWLVLGYEEANSILRSKDFGKRLLENWKPPNVFLRGAMRMLRRKQGSSMLIQDPPDHTRLRSLVNSAFTPGVIHGLEGHIEEIANDLIDKMQERFKSEKEIDLISAFAFQLPVIVIAELLGVPTEHREKFKKWSNDITLAFSGSVNPIRMAKSYVSMLNLRLFLRLVIAEKRRNPKKDLISALVAAQSEDNDRLSNDELLANTVLILIAGHETTVNLISNSVFNLLQHPEQLAKIQSDPELIPNAVEEVLRFDPPVQIIRRLAKKETELGGMRIKENDILTVVTAACNRDPKIVNEPDVFNIEREHIKHLTFGAGIHYCLGAELARTEGRIAIKILFDRIRDLSLSDRQRTYKGPFSLRGFKELYVSRK